MSSERQTPSSTRDPSHCCRPPTPPLHVVSRSDLGHDNALMAASPARQKCLKFQADTAMQRIGIPGQSLAHAPQPLMAPGWITSFLRANGWTASSLVALKSNGGFGVQTIQEPFERKQHDERARCG